MTECHRTPTIWDYIYTTGWKRTSSAARPKLLWIGSETACRRHRDDRARPAATAGSLFGRARSAWRTSNSASTRRSPSNGSWTSPHLTLSLARTFLESFEADPRLAKDVAH